MRSLVLVFVNLWCPYLTHSRHSIRSFKQINPDHVVQHKVAGGENILRILLTKKVCAEECLPDEESLIHRSIYRSKLKRRKELLSFAEKRRPRRMLAAFEYLKCYCRKPDLLVLDWSRKQFWCNPIKVLFAVTKKDWR